MKIKTFLSRLISLAMLLSFPFHAFGIINDVPKDVVLMSLGSIIKDNQTYLAVSFKNHKKWHTYWKNPGDAGLPIKLKFKIGDTLLTPTPLEWPSPKRYLEEGNMWAYGYEDAYSFFFLLNNQEIELMRGKTLSVKATWLICKHICVPGQKKLTATYSNNKIKGQNPQFTISEKELLQRLENLPEAAPFPNNLDLVLAKDPDPKKLGLILYYTLNRQKKDSLLSDMNLLTPFPSAPMAFLHEDLFLDKKGNIYGKFPIDWDGEYQEPPVDLPVNGQFKKPFTIKFLYANPLSQEIQIIKKKFTSFNLTSARSSENFLKLLSKVDIKLKKENKKTIKLMVAKDKNSFWYYLLFAFLGGMILNIMPCVLPVISLKLFGLISHSGESKSRIFYHNMIYTLGVLFTFILLAIVVIAFQKAGSFIGWGFQLQSPIFISITIVVLFSMVLNLFGLFEFRTPGGKGLGNIELSNNYFGDFFGGVIATILATPCSAPFLGTALTFAFSSSPFVIFLIFIMIGLGLSSPFILTAIFPSLISFLPRPGNWMNHVKKFLGLILALTVIWLMDIFVSQTDTTLPLIKLLIVLALILFGILFRSKINKNIFLSAAIFSLPTILFLQMVNSPLQKTIFDNERISPLLKDKQGHGLSWEKFSKEKLQQILEKEQVVFIDFTAKWCFTCKVNERLVLNTESFSELVKQKNIKLLLGDWTNRDEKIGKWLKDHGKVGVPAYFLLDRKGQLHNLGETISISKIKKYL